MSKSWFKMLVCAGFTAVALAGQAAMSPAAHAKVWKIALSNSYIGNEWRVEMINMLKAYVRDNYAGKVDLIINSSGPDVQKQIAAIDDMISQKVDAILIDPVSATALNPVIREATRRGIVVVDFDQNVSAPSAYKVTADFVAMGEAHAQFIADALGGKGNVIINRGVAGFEADTNMYKGNMNVFRKYPGIHVVAEVYGKWDDGVSQTELTKALTAHPDVQGIINQAGEYGALQALLNLKHSLKIAMTGEGSNGWRLAMLKYKDQGLQGLSLGEPPMSSALALKTAVEVLEGKHPPKHQVIPLPRVTTADLEPGVNVFPDQPPTVYADISIPGSGIHLTIQDAQGK